MSFQDTLKADALNIFLSDDFAVAVDYTPVGGSVRHIKGQLGDAVECDFRDGNQSLKWKKRTLEIYAGDDINGVSSPRVVSRDGAGDSCVINGLTLFVVDQLVDGKAAQTWMHMLVLSDKKIAATRK